VSVKLGIVQCLALAFEVTHTDLPCAALISQFLEERIPEKRDEETQAVSHGL
jgi:hypothetical protein